MSVATLRLHLFLGIFLIAGTALLYAACSAIRGGCIYVGTWRTRIPVYRKDDPVGFWSGVLGMAVFGLISLGLAYGLFTSLYTVSFSIGP